MASRVEHLDSGKEWINHKLKEQAIGDDTQHKKLIM